MRRRAFALDGRVSAEWSRYPGSMARRAGDSVAPLRQSSEGWMSSRIERLSSGVGCRHPVTIHKASLVAAPMRRVRDSANEAQALWYHPGAQYPAVEWTRTKVAVRSVVVPVPQTEPASRLKSSTRDVNFLRSDSRCGGTLVTYPTLLRGMWARSKGTGFRCSG